MAMDSALIPPHSIESADTADVEKVANDAVQPTELSGTQSRVMGGIVPNQTRVANTIPVKNADPHGNGDERTPLHSIESSDTADVERFETEASELTAGRAKSPIIEQLEALRGGIKGILHTSPDSDSYSGASRHYAEDTNVPIRQRWQNINSPIGMREGWQTIDRYGKKLSRRSGRA